MERLHVIVIGPGLGREPTTFDVITEIIRLCAQQRKPLVIDADGLFLVANRPETIKDYPPPGVVLTPNAIEFARLVSTSNFEQENDTNFAATVQQLGENVTVVCKGIDDMIFNKNVQVSNRAQSFGALGCALVITLTFIFKKMPLSINF